MKQIIVLEVEQTPENADPPYRWNWSTLASAPCTVMWAGPVTDDPKELALSGLVALAEMGWPGEVPVEDVTVTGDRL